MSFRDLTRLRFGALIIRDGQVLVTKNNNYHLFTLPGGKIEDGESVDECFTRELKEEISCKFISAKYFGSYLSKEDGVDRVNAAFLVEINGIPKASAEVEKIDWFNSKDLDKLGPSTSQIIKDAINAKLVK